ncbi:SbcC/MukB-like Walker B domain-containing protein [Bacillus carboniphilus]|uniref:Nuclease SbcCD subunit C n=1 Tax=Bacillus carboniphilus TaxID=86663 RepID=A0ABY9JWM9_9BACI|nr:AAA family ATPase [Bacillus carboniphilus]WLR42902.1 SbcC/MukB-like Walker B domain-containing protein [Bacillus carboniphilus]
MKPIKLTIAGLHSFKEKQTIDFDQLCSGGVFGIFGPTGSGKSSILDAMTLALYGKVERAPNNTQGIINHGEDQLSVSFSFQLQNGDVTKSYKIERLFKRTDEVKVKSSMCRLIEEGYEQVVLADKTNEVNQKVQQLLGLTIDDFTRAVVLPQGKFAEFLSLKGTERRQMLQRIFNLEKYGDLLNKKIKHRLSSDKAFYNELNAEKSGLGDASTEALTEARKKLALVEEELKKRMIEQNQLEKEVEEAKEIWSLQIEHDQVQEKKNQLLQNQDQILLLKNQFQNALEAKQLEPYAQSVDQLEKELAQVKQHHHDLAEQVEKMKIEYEEKQRLFEQARKYKAESEPKLLLKKERLHQWVKLEKEVMNEEKGYLQLLKKEKSVKEQYTQLDQSEQSVGQTLDKALEKQQMLKQELQSKAVSNKERQLVQAAYHIKQQISQLAQKEEEWKQALQKKQKEMSQHKEQLEKMNNNIRYHHEKMTEGFNRLSDLYSYFEDLKRDIESRLERLKEQKEQKKQWIETLHKKHAAYQIRHQLQEGNPCPVCGSLEHPSPVEDMELDNQKEERELHQLEKWEQNLQDLSVVIEMERSKLQEQSDSLIEEFSLRLSNPKENSNENNNILDDKQLKAEVTSLKQDALQLKQQLQTHVQEMRSISQKPGHIKEVLDSFQKEMNDYQKKLEEIEKLIVMEKQSWVELNPSFAFHEVENMIKHHSERDQQMEKIQERIETSVQFIEDKQNQLKQYGKQKLTVAKQLSEIKATLQYYQKSIQDKKAQLPEIAQSESFTKQLEKIDVELEKLTKEEQGCYLVWQDSSDQLKKTENQYVSIKDKNKDLKNRLLEANRAWEDRQKDSRFDTLTEVFESVLSNDELKTIEKQMNEYEQQMNELNSHLFRLNERLNGRNLTQEEWERLQQRAILFRKKLDEAVEEKGAALRSVDDLLKKHERYQEIESKLIELQETITKYEQLQKVFKGNSFVEYVAEEQLMQVSRDATEHLRMLTRGRYAIEVDSQGGFLMRDDANGGVKRPVSSLSGGETFLTSLALALSLSANIQLRGEYPLQFFFLDEGFGTLDADLLDTVVSALEKLQSKNLSVGVISHVQELRSRLPRKLMVNPADPTGTGSTVQLEIM